MADGGLSRLLDAVCDDTFAARIEVFEEAARGGMGVVYRASIRATDEPIAIKELSPTDDVDIERFLREAAVLERMDHPGIVRYREHGALRDGRYYLAVDWLDGEDLRTRLNRDGMSTELAVAVARQIAEALAHAHGLGVVHRDVKPANIMLLDRDGVTPRTVLVDFGISRQVHAEHETITRSGQIVGTPGYFAPEQLTAGAVIEGRTDVFALGCVLFEMCAGERAFAGDDVVQLLVDVITSEPVDVRERRGDVPPRVATLLKAMMDKDATRRPTAAEVALELSEIGEALGDHDDAVLSARSPLLSEHPTAGVAVTSPSATRPERQRDARLLIVVAPFIVVAAIAVVAWWGADAPRSVAVTAPTAEPRASLDAVAFAAFRAGAWRDAIERLEEVTRQDPTNAAAHLRLAVWQLPRSPSKARQRYQLALRYRDTLDPDQAGLLDAREPYLREPWDLDAWVTRLQAHLASYPGDLEARFYLALAHHKRLDFEAALAELDGIVSTDERVVVAWELRGRVLAMQGLGTATLDNDSRCLAANPSSAACLSRRAKTYMRRGECDKMRVDTARLTSISPGDPRAHRQLANALIATGAPQPAVDLALERARELQTDVALRPVEALEMRARGAFVAGDFEGAERDLEAWREAVRHRIDQYDSAEPAILLLRLYAEQGRDEDAATVASDELAHLASRGEPTGGKMSVHFLLPRARAGLLTADELRQRRKEWLSDYRAKWAAAGRQTGVEFAWIAWSTVYGFSVRDAEEARAAMAEMPAQMPKTIDSGRWAAMDLNIGRVLVLAGEWERSIPHLKRAARSCERLGEPHLYPLANVCLGSALQQLGRTEEAAAAFERVVAVWGEAPRSRAVAAARDGLSR